MENSMSYSNAKRPWDFFDEHSSQPTKRLQLGPEFPYASSGGDYVDPFTSSTVPSSTHTAWELGIHDLGYRSDFGDIGFTLGTQPDVILEQVAINTTIQAHAGAEAFEPTLHLYQEVCFGLVRTQILQNSDYVTKSGQIPDIQVRLNKDFDSNLDLYFSVLSPQDPLVSPRWSLLFDNGRCDVVTPSGRAAAVLHQHSFKVLDRLQKAVPVKFELSAWSVGNLRSRKSSKESLSRFTNLELVALGQRSAAETVAATFASEEVFLQDPADLPAGIAYENPQMLELPDFALTFSSPQSGHSASNDIQAPNPHEWMGQSDSTFDFEKLLDDFACQHDLAQAASDRHVLTPLLEYVYFVRVIADANYVQAIKKRL
jgi:hypothetical protein